MYIIISLLLRCAFTFNPAENNVLDTLTLTYSVSTNQTQITFIFSAPLGVNAQQFEQLIAIDIGNLVGYTYTAKQSNGFTFLIELDYSEQFYFEETVIRFLAPYEIRSQDNTQYLNRKYQVLKLNMGPYLIQSDLESNVMFVLELFTYGMLGLSVLMFIAFKTLLRIKSEEQQDIGQTLNLFWIYLDSVQLLNILMYLNTYMTPQARSEFIYLKYGNFNFQYNRIYQQIANIPEDKQMVTNSIQWSLIILSGILTIISKLFLKQIPGIQGTLKDLIEYRLVMRSISICIWSLSLTSFQQVEYFEFNDNVGITNFSIAIFTFLFIIGYFIFIFRTLNHTKVGDMGSRCFGVLFDGLQTKAFFKRNFYLFLELRKVMYTAVIVLLYNSQNTCISIIVIAQILFVTILATKFPFRVRVINLIMLWSEIAITIVATLLACIIILDYVSASYIQTITRNITGWIIVAFTLSILLIRCISMIIEYYNLLKQDYRQNQEDAEQILPDDYGMVEMVRPQ